MASRKGVKKASAWGDVYVGDIVQLSNNGCIKYVGEVGARTPDGDVIWVHDPVRGRRLFHIHDGYTLRLAPS